MLKEKKRGTDFGRIGRLRAAEPCHNRSPSFPPLLHTFPIETINFPFPPGYAEFMMDYVRLLD